MYQPFFSLFWLILECIKRFSHFRSEFSSVSSVFLIILVDFRVYEAFLSLFWCIFDCIKRFCHFFGGFSSVLSVAIGMSSGVVM